MVLSSLSTQEQEVHVTLDFSMLVHEGAFCFFISLLDNSEEKKGGLKRSTPGILTSFFRHALRLYMT